MRFSVALKALLKQEIEDDEKQIDKSFETKAKKRNAIKKLFKLKKTTI